MATLTPGQIEDGHEFLGGNPADPQNWRVVDAPADALQPGHVEAGFQFMGGAPADPRNWRPVTESWSDYAGGVGRSLAQGATLGWGDEAIAAARAATGNESYGQALEAERQALERFKEAHPYVSFGAELAGGAVMPVGAGANVLRQGVNLGRVARGAATVGAPAGAVYGLGQSTGLNPVKQTEGEFYSQALRDAATGAATGAAGFAVAAPVAARLAAGVRPRTDTGAVQTLLAEGVPLTPGMIRGGFAKRLEDTGMSIPGVGMLVRNAQQDAVQGLNTAAINRSLRPIGEQLPRDVRFGHEAVDYAATKLSDAYNDVVPHLRGEIDNGLMNDLAALERRAVDLPDEALGERFNKIMNVQVWNRAEPNTFQFTGEALKKAESELGRLSTNYMKDPSADMRDLGIIIADAQTALRDMVARANPDAAPVLQRINEGWKNYTRVRAAASAAGSTGGVFNPTQFNAAVRAADKSVGRGDTARGRAFMQDLADAAKTVIPSKVPDSGTPERSAVLLGLGGLGGHAAGLLNPASILAAALLAGAYTRPGQAVLRAVMTRRPVSSTALADALRAATPALAAAGGRATAHTPERDRR